MLVVVAVFDEVLEEGSWQERVRTCRGFFFCNKSLLKFFNRVFCLVGSVFCQVGTLGVWFLACKRGQKTGVCSVTYKNNLLVAIKNNLLVFCHAFGTQTVLTHWTGKDNLT